MHSFLDLRRLIVFLYDHLCRFQPHSGQTDYWHSEMVEAGVPPTTESFKRLAQQPSTTLN